MQALKRRALFYLLFFSALVILIILILQPLSILQFGHQISILFPQGVIGLAERNLLFVIQALMLLVIVPVYILTFIFSWKYNANNPKGKYDPDLVDSWAAEVVWWGVPLVMVAIVAVLTWVKTYELDPFKPLDTTQNKQKTIQVVSLQWKWLFIYPEEQIASLNFVQIPQNTPIRFEITGDSPMNSFWIPSLGGQIYAMPNMKTILHLIANSIGDFRGYSANISGEGFSDMHFITRASTQENYEQWVQTVKQSSHTLNREEYERLAAPGVMSPQVYQLQDEKLFNYVLMKYMHPKRE